MSYDHGNNGVGESLATWFTIFTRGRQLLLECLVKGQAGGSAIVGGKSYYLVRSIEMKSPSFADKVSSA